MLSIKDIIKNHIQKNLNKYYSKLQIKKAQISIKPYHRLLITTPYSEAQFLCKISIKQRDKSDIIKYIFAKKFGNASREFKNFQKIKKITYGASRMVPYYFDLIKDKNIIFVEYIHPAQNLLYKFLKLNIPSRDKVESKKLITMIAKWLVNFQKRFTFDKTMNLNSYISQAKNELRALNYFSKGEKEELINKIKKESRFITDIPRVFSGDLYLRHILISNDELIVVDWDNLKITHPYYDIHSLFINLESRTRHPGVFTKKYISELEEDFLKVYKKLSKFEFSEKAYKVTRTMYLIHFLYSYNWRYKNKILHTKKMPFWRYFMYNVKREVRNYLPR